MSATLEPMSKSKSDRHKPRRMVGIPERIAAALEQMGRERESSLSEMVKTACREFLERCGRWPPADKRPPKSAG